MGGFDSAYIEFTKPAAKAGFLLARLAVIKNGTTAMNNPISHVLQQLHDAVNRGDQDALSQCYANDAKVVATPMSSSTQTKPLKTVPRNATALTPYLNFKRNSCPTIL